jgi:hypothetical protein
MKKLVPVLLFILLLAGCKKDATPAPTTSGPFFPGSELPYFQVTTDVAIENEPKVPGDLKVFIEGDLVFESPIGIEYRGSTSFRLSDKKSYGFETWDEADNDVNASILGFPEEEDWILMGHVYRASEGRIFDPTLMRHFIGYELFRNMGNYASRCQFIELEVNDDFAGTYIFMEKLKRDNERIDIARLDPDENEGEDLTGGYILKIDKTAGGDVAPGQPLSYYENNWDDDARYNEDISFRSAYDVNGQPLAIEPFGPPYHPEQYLETYFLYEYPDAADISDQQKAYIQNYIYAFETALLTDDFAAPGRTYTDYIDPASFVDYFILNEVVSNVDAYRLSTFMYKDKNDRLKLGPVWDLNIGYNGQGRVPRTDWIVNYNDYVPTDAWLVPFWWDRLLEDPQFTDLLKSRWNELRANVLATATVENLVRQTANYLIDNGAIDRNYERWTGAFDFSYNSEVDAMVSYLRERLDWMDGAIANL